MMKDGYLAAMTVSQKAAPMAGQRAALRAH